MKFIYEVNQEIEQYKYRIIYGSGISAVELYMSIAEQGKTVDFFCDMVGFPAGKQLLNRKIITLEEAAEFGEEACVIICKEYAAAVIDRMNALRIKHIYVS